MYTQIQDATYFTDRMVARQALRAELVKIGTSGKPNRCLTAKSDPGFSNLREDFDFLLSYGD